MVQPSKGSVEWIEDNRIGYMCDCGERIVIDASKPYSTCCGCGKMLTGVIDIRICEHDDRVVKPWRDE